MLNYAIESYIKCACEKMNVECTIISGSENFFNVSVTDTTCPFGSRLIFFVDPIKVTIQDGICSGKVFMRVVFFFTDLEVEQEENFADFDMFIQGVIRTLTSREVDQSIDSRYRIVFAPVEYKQFINYSDDCAFGFSLSFNVKSITSVC